MEKSFKIFCYTDIHCQQAMLDYPTTVRKSAYIATKKAVKEFGKADIAICGGDNISDYPHWEKSCALPKKNFLDFKQKLVKCLGKSAKGKKVLYVAGNNDMFLGDIGTADNEPYNTTEFYFDGPMNKTLGILGENDCQELKSIHKPNEKYLGTFHYNVGGYDFFGINIDPDTSFNSHEGYYADSSLDWLKRKLDEVDPTGKKPLFVAGHLSAVFKYLNDEDFTETLINGNVEKFYDTFKGHKNLFYLYGHVHGERACYKNFSSGAVYHLDKNNKPLGYFDNITDSKNLGNYEYTIVHMGGLRPFKRQYFEDKCMTGYGGESEKKAFPSTANPKLAQYLVIEVFDDRAVFYIRNTGTLEGYTQKDILKPYTVYFQK